jgi:Ca2+-binding EF-hand superfamily protein
MSLGEDKRLVEYNLENSDIESGLRVRSAHKMTQGAVPTGLLWTTESLIDDRCVPKAKNGRSSVPDMLLMTTNEFKLKVHATDSTRQCLKTVLGPTFAGPISNMLVVPSQAASRTRCIVYSTHERVVGMLQLPLEGNPREALGLVAHPAEVSSICVSHDGKYLFTAGGRDCAVMQWRLNPEAAAVRGGGKLGHFIEVIEGGPNGAFMKEIIDYFFYAQIRAQGEETTAKRRIEGTIPFGQVPNLMRALGFYPSVKDIGNMTYEVSTRFGRPGIEVADIQIDFETFMRLYVNHRPVFGISKRNIEAAFNAIGADPVTGIVDRQELFTTLQQRGEVLEAPEVDMILKSLLGDDVTLDMLEEKITAKAFAENLLGFEDYEDEGANGGAAAAASQA